MKRAMETKNQKRKCRTPYITERIRNHLLERNHAANGATLIHLRGHAAWGNAQVITNDVLCGINQGLWFGLFDCVERDIIIFHLNFESVFDQRLADPNVFRLDPNKEIDPFEAINISGEHGLRIKDLTLIASMYQPEKTIDKISQSIGGILGTRLQFYPETIVKIEKTWYAPEFAPEQPEPAEAETTHVIHLHHTSPSWENPQSIVLHFEQDISFPYPPVHGVDTHIFTSPPPTRRVNRATPPVSLHYENVVSIEIDGSLEAIPTGEVFILQLPRE